MRLVLAFLLGLLTSILSCHASENEVALLAPGYGELEFTPAKPGSYQLPVLAKAYDGKVLNSDGQWVQLQQLFKGKYNLLSFIYTRCNDLNGCPLTQVVYSRIRYMLNQQPELKDKLRLLSLSFDPQYDTPQVLKGLSQSLAQDDGPQWHYLTSDSNQNLKPILDAYEQAVLPLYDQQGNDIGMFSHILRVFLIDPDSNIRNIYDVSFLHPDMIIADLKTLLLSEQQELGVKELSEGSALDLLSLVAKPPLGLPQVPVPEDNLLSKEKVALGKKLFFDRRLSLNNTMSCAMCHIPEQGFTNNELKTPAGFEGRTVRRNAATIFNSAYVTQLHTDGRETSLENQIWQPLLASAEMNMPSIGMVIKKINQATDYDGLFEQAFAGQSANVVTIGQAIASYERTLLSADSAFDRWFFAAQTNAISAAAKAGFELFKGKAGCINCHTVQADHALFSDDQLHNTGVGWAASMLSKPQLQQVEVAPGQYLAVKQTIIDSVGHGTIGDLGLYEVTQDPDDRWRYRTPTLRNIELTAPYMHDGSLASLEAVISHYNQGGYQQNPTQSPLIKPLHLNALESQQLVAFLKTLTGSNVNALVADALTTKIGDSY